MQRRAPWHARQVYLNGLRRPPPTTAEYFYLGAMDLLLAHWREAGEQPEQLAAVLHRTEQRALANAWPMIQRGLR